VGNIDYSLKIYLTERLLHRGKRNKFEAKEKTDSALQNHGFSGSKFSSHRNCCTVFFLKILIQEILEIIIEFT